MAVSYTHLDVYKRQAGGHDLSVILKYITEAVIKFFLIAIE